MHWRPASIESLPQRDRRLYRMSVWCECTEGGSHYRIWIQPIIRRFIDHEVPAQMRGSLKLFLLGDYCTKRCHREMI